MADKFYEVTVTRMHKQEQRIGVHAESEEEAVRKAMESRKVHSERSGARNDVGGSALEAQAVERTYNPGA